MTPSTESLLASFPEYAKDLKLNLQGMFASSSLEPQQRLGVALASAAATRHPALTAALRADLEAQGAQATVEDALAAATLMGMTNVYYRFLHLVGQEAYGQMPPRLRMGRVARPAGPKADFELFCLAVSAINGCATCVQAHERTLREAGLGEEQVQDALRIASTLHGLASVPA